MIPPNVLIIVGVGVRAVLLWLGYDAVDSEQQTTQIVGAVTVLGTLAYSIISKVTDKRRVD